MRYAYKTRSYAFLGHPWNGPRLGRTGQAFLPVVLVLSEVEGAVQKRSPYLRSTPALRASTDMNVCPTESTR